MTLDGLQLVLGALSGGLIGLTLGLIGGGGSILAVPLMVYLVGVPSAHVAIGTSAMAVAANAGTGLVSHARARTVNWRCGGLFAAAGVLGALIGSSIGKAVDGQRLLSVFALIMLVVAGLMLRRRRDNDMAAVTLHRGNAPKVAAYGLGTGMVSGFFGIGGGFLIVPGLVASTRMAMINAIGTSLIAVTAFGLTTAANYAFSGYVNWLLAAVLVGGGTAGCVAGAALARRLSGTRTLATLFAALLVMLAAYMLWHGAPGAMHSYPVSNERR